VALYTGGDFNMSDDDMLERKFVGWPKDGVFKCIERCGKCCGAVPISEEVYEKHKAKLAANTTVVKSADDKPVYLLVQPNGHCGFLDWPTKLCMIYNDRPEVCRIMGSEELPCPYVKPDGKKRSRQEYDAMKRKIEADTDLFLRGLSDGRRHSPEGESPTAER
jgi:hypothetical protein